MLNRVLLSRPTAGTRTRLLLALAVIAALGLLSARALSASPAAAAPEAASGSLPTARFLTLALAEKAANAAIDECHERGFPVAVAVLDRDGVVILIQRADGATGATVDVSKGKAFAAVGFQSPTSGLQDAARTQPGLIAIPGFVILPGGLPIASGSTVVAGIGVSGAPTGDIDAACAQTGIDAIKGSL